MKLIKPFFEIIEQQSGLKGIYKQIELAGRTCYKSEDKITNNSAKDFVDRMIKLGHGSILEHGTIYLDLITSYAWDHYKTVNNKYGCEYVTNETVHNESIVDKYKSNKYSIVKTISSEFIPLPDNYGGYQEHSFITTNLRVLVENNWTDDLKYICEPTKFHEKRVTVRFICDRVTGESFLRHRAIDENHPTLEGEVTREKESDINSFARESTRYCNYSKNKFDNQFTIIAPPEFYDNDIIKSLSYFGDNDDKILKNMCCAISAGEIEENFDLLETWIFANLSTQWAYNRLIKLGWKPQQARRIIPMNIKSPLVMTGFVSDWKHFFELRCSPSAHPQAQELAIPLKDEFIKRGYIHE